jgi:hypothetical protein
VASILGRLISQRGVVLLGRLVGALDGKIHLAADLKENLLLADSASADFKREIDASILKAGIDAPAPEPDPFDEARSDAGDNHPRRSISKPPGSRL